MNPNYQRHLDILRALAVLLVIFHHLKIPYFNGGFIGVDVFLVISGYLITKNIKNEKLRTAHFSVRNFYNKRVIRLAPSFFLVILTSMIAFFFILTPEEWGKFLKTIIASISLTSNIYYSILLNDYFKINPEATPLLHLWSLSLEEQFYLVWPILLILLLRLKNIYIFLTLSLTIIFSIFLSHIYVIKNPVAAYYLLPARFFEFLFGALLTFIKPIKIQKNISFLIGLTLILCIIIMNIIINKDSLFPSYIAAFPCFFAALYILLSGGLTHKKIQLFEYIGKISYPMYLWHWPIISYLTLLSVNLNGIQKLLIIILIILISILTYEFLEKKLSKIFYNNNRAFIYLILLPSIPILLAYLYHTKSYENTEKIITNKNPTFSIKCIDNSSHPLESCYLGQNKKHDIDILLVGDSHANSQSGMIDVLAKNANLKGYEITFSSTAYLVDVDRYSINSKTNEIKKVNQFTDINIFIQDHIKNNHFKYVVMGGFFPHNWNRSIYSEKNRVPLDRSQSKQAFIYGLKQAISSIIKSGARPILINDNPILVDVDVNCHLRFFNDFDHCTFPRLEHDRDFKEWQTVLAELQKSFPKLIVIDFTEIICGKKKCFSALQNTSLYRDSHHLTYNGSSILGSIYLQKHSNPFLEGH